MRCLWLLPLVYSLLGFHGLGHAERGPQSFQRSKQPSRIKASRWKKTRVGQARSKIPPVIFRQAEGSPSSLTRRPGEDALSFQDSLFHNLPTEGYEPGDVLRLSPGKNVIAVDTSLLPRGSVKADGGKFGHLPGHVSVVATPEQIKEAMIGRVRIPKTNEPEPATVGNVVRFLELVDAAQAKRANAGTAKR